MKNFALFGSAGYIAPRHINAIKETGNNLIAAIDPNVRRIHQFPHCQLFKDKCTFSLWLKNVNEKVDYISICSPSFLHAKHCSFAAQRGINVICEKPIALTKTSFDLLLEDEKHRNKAKIYPIMQLRLLESIGEMKAMRKPKEITITCHTPRDEKYLKTWKGDDLLSGGIITNLGIHFFDLIDYVFGIPSFTSIVYNYDKTHIDGTLLCPDFNIYFDFNISSKIKMEKSIFFDQKNVISLIGNTQFSHTKSYQQILDGKGFSLRSVRKATLICDRINSTIRNFA